MSWGCGRGGCWEWGGNIQCTVEKDVIRTDKSHPYFRGEKYPKNRSPQVTISSVERGGGWG